MSGKTVKTKDGRVLTQLRHSPFEFSLYRDNEAKCFYLLYDSLPETFVPVPLVPVPHDSGFLVSGRLADLLFRQLEKECGKLLKRAGGSQNKI